MKTTNILIPTDFSLASLKVIPALLQNQPDTKFCITVVNFLGLSDSITDLLMLSRRNREYEHVTQEFLDECTRLMREHADRIACLQTEFFYGNTVALFKNYLEAREIEQIAKLKDHTLVKLTSRSYDPESLFDRSNLPVVNLAPYQKPKQAKVKALHTVNHLELERV